MATATMANFVKNKLNKNKRGYDYDKTEEQLEEAGELVVRINTGRFHYPHAREACEIMQTILLGLGFVGEFILHLETMVRSRSPERFKLKSGSSNGVHVIIKPAGQDSATKFKLIAPSSAHPIEVYNALRTYVNSLGAVGLDDGPDEPIEPAPATIPFETTVPAPLAALLPPVPEPVPAPPEPLPANPSDLLGAMVQLQQHVMQLRFQREARQSYEKICLDLKEQHELLTLELQEVAAKLAKAQAECSELTVVSDQELATAENRWRKVEDGLNLLRGALGGYRDTGASA